MTIPKYVGVPDTQAIRDDLVNYAADDCPWNLIEEALDEIDRLRAVVESYEPNAGHVVVNNVGEVRSYIHWPKPEGVRWTEAWDIMYPDEGPHRIARLVPVEE